jgi:hypothetical protein
MTMSLADIMPSSWSISGVHGRDAASLMVRRTVTIDGVTCRLARFPPTVTPSPFASVYTTQAGFDVAHCFEGACRHIVERSARSRRCNSYFRDLEQRPIRWNRSGSIGSCQVALSIDLLGHDLPTE